MCHFFLANYSFLLIRVRMVNGANLIEFGGWVKHEQGETGFDEKVSIDC